MILITYQRIAPAVVLYLLASASIAEPLSRESLAHAEMLRAQAMMGSNAMAIVTSLTTEVGPRLAGSQAEARARVWAIKTLTEKGFANVRNEPFEMIAWERYEEGAEILTPYPQPLAVTALGCLSLCMVQLPISPVRTRPIPWPWCCRPR